MKLLKYKIVTAAFYLGSVVVATWLLNACVAPKSKTREPKRLLPGTYNYHSADSLWVKFDTSNAEVIPWKEYFNDPLLVALIDSALKNQQELKIMEQEIIAGINKARFQKAFYLPLAQIYTGLAADKPSKYTRTGVIDEQLPIINGKANPAPLGDVGLGLQASWEIDIWKKLRNKRKAAIKQYMATMEGKNYLTTLLVSEMAKNYYELSATATKLSILEQYISLLNQVLNIVVKVKTAGRTTELAVKRFEAEILNTTTMRYALYQKRIELLNKINLLIGKRPESINYPNDILPLNVATLSGVPSPAHLLKKRPDVRQALLELEAANIEVTVAKAEFYPSLNLLAAAGTQGLNFNYFLRPPASLLYLGVGQMLMPLINRNALKANLYTATAHQHKLTYQFEKTALKAFYEVNYQLNNIANTENSIFYKSKQVDTLNQAVDVSYKLFQAARADYMEVLLTQREALVSKIELVELKRNLFDSHISLYQAVGGGYR